MRSCKVAFLVSGSDDLLARPVLLYIRYISSLGYSILDVNFPSHILPDMNQDSTRIHTPLILQSLAPCSWQPDKNTVMFPVRLLAGGRNSESLCLWVLGILIWGLRSCLPQEILPFYSCSYATFVVSSKLPSPDFPPLAWSAGPERRRSSLV